LKRIFEEKKWLNLNSKPDKECRKCGDIVFLSEIIANYMYWQDTCNFMIVAQATLYGVIVKIQIS
jgi:hypothetical protein